MGGWKPANEEGCSHREVRGAEPGWLEELDVETQRTEASVVQGETPACPGRATTARIAMISETIGKGDGIQMGLQAVQTPIVEPPVISRPGMSSLRPGG